VRVLTICLALAFVCTGASFAADVTLPGVPAPGTEPPTITAPPPSEQIKPVEHVPGPLLETPSPIEPSKPVGPVPHPTRIPEQAGNYIGFSADSARTTFDNGKPVLTIVTGNVTARYKDMLITAEKGQVDYKTNLAVFEGNVVFRLGIQEARGERIEINIDTFAWSIASAKITVTPEFAKGMIKAPIFASAAKITGLRDRQVSAYGSTVTTCDLPHEHYDIVTREMTVYPNDKIVFRNASFFVLGKRLFSLPRFVVPIKDIEKNPNLIPRFGQSAEEGVYVKLGYSALASKSNMTFVLADLMQRKGVGLGIQDFYKTAGGSGSAYFYSLNDQNIGQHTLTGRLKHSQVWGDLKMEASSDFRSNSYLYAPQSKSLDNRLSFTRDTPGSRSSLIVSQSISSVFQRTTTTAANLRDTETFDPKTSLATSFDYTGYGSPAGTRARLTSQTLFTKRGEKFDWDISAQKLTDLSDEAFVGKGQFGGIERLPEVSISSDTARLGHILPFNLPARMRFSYGRFVQVPLSENDRAFLDITSPSTQYSLTNTWSATTGGGFKQFVYGDNTAQYSVDAEAQLSKKLGDTSTFALTYRYQKPKGFTPFRFDFVGKYNIVNASLNLADSEKFKVSLVGGYNFEQSQFPWQDSVFRFSYQPTKSVLLYTATGYDFNRSQWRQVINQLRIRAKDTFKLDIGTRYDPISSKLATVRGLLDTAVGNRNHVQAIAGWNGFTNTFDYRGLSITRDLHCWEASITYVNQGGFYTNNGIYFNIRIKAFPLLDNFGMGNFGQALDTSVGQVY
jgi:lipopolysaccharide export system protein LptA